MLHYNDDLRLAHLLKERFFEICQNTKYSEQRTDFFDWIKMPSITEKGHDSKNRTPTIDIEPLFCQIS